MNITGKQGINDWDVTTPMKPGQTEYTMRCCNQEHRYTCMSSIVQQRKKLGEKTRSRTYNQDEVKVQNCQSSQRSDENGVDIVMWENDLVQRNKETQINYIECPKQKVISFFETVP